MAVRSPLAHETLRTADAGDEKPKEVIIDKASAKTEEKANPEMNVEIDAIYERHGEKETSYTFIRLKPSQDKRNSGIVVYLNLEKK